jgi:branched-chain amino acid transport system permease protein
VLDYIFHICINIGIFSILAYSLSVLAGYSGQISLAQASFFAIGAYTAATLGNTYHLDLLIVIAISILFSTISSRLLCIFTNRTVDDYYIVITIGFQFLIYSIIKNLPEVTGGTNGISGIKTAMMFSYVFEHRYEVFLLVQGALVITILVLYLLSKSKFGKQLRAVGDDQIWAYSVGIDVEKYKTTANIMSASIASVAGVLYAYYAKYIDPSSFTLEESIYILCIVIIGGMRKISGIFIATSILVILPEIFRLIGFQGGAASNIRQLMYGAGLVAVIFMTLRSPSPQER